MKKQPATAGMLPLFDEPAEDDVTKFWCKCGGQVEETVGGTRRLFWCRRCQRQLKYYELFRRP